MIKGVIIVGNTPAGHLFAFITGELDFREVNGLSANTVCLSAGNKLILFRQNYDPFLAVCYLLVHM